MCQLQNFKHFDKPECMIKIRKIYTEVVQQIKNMTINFVHQFYVKCSFDFSSRRANSMKSK